MSKKISRSLYLLVLMSSLSFGVYFVLNGLNSSIVFFYTPTEVSQLSHLPQNQIRVGGIVKSGSIKHNMPLSFTLTDCSKELIVTYNGNTPPLFREGQGIVASGKLSSHDSLMADTLLTKHDENYKPKTLPLQQDQKNDTCKFNEQSMK